MDQHRLGHGAHQRDAPALICQTVDGGRLDRRYPVAVVVELTLWTEPGTLCVEVVDHGNWVPPVERPAVDGLADRGRGIPLMSSMAEAVLIHHDSRGSRVLLRHPVPADRDPADLAQLARPHPVPVAPGVPTPSGSASRGSGVGTHRPSTGA